MSKPPPFRPPGTPGRKPDNVPAARSRFQTVLAQRVRAGRARLARKRGHAVSQAEVAEMLSSRVGYEVSADRYRKYEGGKEPTFMPHDLLFHFAELTDTTVGTLLAPVPDPDGEPDPEEERRQAG